MEQIIIETIARNNFKINLLDVLYNKVNRNIKIELVDNGERIIVADSNIIHNYCDFKYSSYYYNKISNEKHMVENIMALNFNTDWEYFIKSNNDNFLKMYKTLIKDYEPLNNYDKNSSITTEFLGKENDNTEMLGTEKNNINFTGSEKNKNIKSGNITQNNPEMLTINSVKSEELQSFAEKDSTKILENTSKTTYNAITDDNTTSFDNRNNNETKTFENRMDKNIKSFEDRKNVVTEKTSGNIGVTTSQQMLESEMLLRIKWNLTQFIVDNFVYKTCTPE